MSNSHDLYNAAYHLGKALQMVKAAAGRARRKSKALDQVATELEAARAFVQAAQGRNHTLPLAPLSDRERLDALEAMVMQPLPKANVDRYGLYRFVRVSRPFPGGNWDRWVVEHDGRDYEGKTLRDAIDAAAAAMPSGDPAPATVARRRSPYALGKLPGQTCMRDVTEPVPAIVHCGETLVDMPGGAYCPRCGYAQP